ncbi:transposase [Corynebacterium liangguodongii]|uniref:Uncharacterized protein n=1 Tax=Corynebacterium liangguodongii TaxID=2079535 RepID=A0A2S0WES4_9CORY|nr:hypothetical protein C3E79_07155 [Corynebacterium liangguodongii]PWC00294.1 hypothetical protein DF219_03790 [Corynebacterium liangguodongii]
MPTEYTAELKQRAIELVLHAQAGPATARRAVTRIAAELGVSRETLRVWVRKDNNYDHAGLLSQRAPVGYISKSTHCRLRG